jgi:hypothetical protein
MEKGAAGEKLMMTKRKNESERENYALEIERRKSRWPCTKKN